MSGDELIFLAVLLLRLGVPLFIPRFPLPAILAALVIDAADQTIFQNTTDLNLDGYQGYDKALDVYYLTVAYLAMVRNWGDPFAFRTGQFLWYYRLSGVLLFEITGVRALLIIFPNTFEYFFIAYETVRLWWQPGRLNKKQVITMAAAIWIFIKLPQEWWIHIAQLDFTDFMKEDVFGVSATASWVDAIGENLWFLALLVVVVAVAVVGVRRLRERLPPPDWSITFDVDRTRHQAEITPAPDPDWQPVVSWYMFEKIALVSMVTTIFALVLPDNEVTALGVVVPVGFVIIANSFASTWLARRGRSWSSTLAEFATMLVVNIASALVFIVLVRRSDSAVNEGATVFFVLLLTLIVTLFDRYHRRESTAVFGGHPTR
ncbi:MAG: hypothetical protein GY745_03340 [Actinomycetia bacterium]|nr:hypothetical protein [Actinomycetes bacterium]